MPRHPVSPALSGAVRSALGFVRHLYPCFSCHSRQRSKGSRASRHVPQAELLPFARIMSGRHECAEGGTSSVA